MLAADADPNWRGEKGRTPLHEALSHPVGADRSRTVLALLAAGAIADAEDDYGTTPCDLAAGQLQSGIDPEIVCALLDARHMTDGRAREQLGTPVRRYRAARDAFLSAAERPAHPVATPYDDDAALKAAYLSAYREGVRAAMREEPRDVASTPFETVSYAGAAYVRLGVPPVEQARELGTARGRRAGTVVANELMREAQLQWELDAARALDKLSVSVRARMQRGARATARPPPAACLPG